MAQLNWFESLTQGLPIIVSWPILQLSYWSPVVSWPLLWLSIVFDLLLIFSIEKVVFSVSLQLQGKKKKNLSPHEESSLRPFVSCSEMLHHRATRNLLVNITTFICDWLSNMWQVLKLCHSCNVLRLNIIIHSLVLQSEDLLHYCEQHHRWRCWSLPILSSFFREWVCNALP